MAMCASIAIDWLPKAEIIEKQIFLSAL